MNLPSIKQPAWLPYLLPMGLFLGMNSLEGMIPRKDGAIDPTLYCAAYCLKIVVVGIAMILCRSAWSDLKPRPSATWIGISVVVGLIVTALWVTIPSPPIPFVTGEQSRAGFDPGVLSGGLKPLFLVARFLGLVLLVPVFEELFWRSFVWRWIMNQDFERVEIGAASLLGAGVSSVMFALVHPEWLPALITGLVWAGLLIKSRSLLTCVVSHMTANLALGIYILATSKWYFW